MGANNSKSQVMPCVYEHAVDLIESEDYDLLDDYLKSVNKQALRDYCMKQYPLDEYLRTLLHHCCWRADDKALKVFFAHFDELDLETTDILGMTPLAASVNRSNIKAARALLVKGASINCDGRNGYYLMRAAVFNANIELVKLLLEHGCETINESYDYENGSLLHIACDYGNTKLISVLIEFGQMLANIEDKFKIQPMHIAASRNDLDLLMYLHKNGVDLNSEDLFGNTPTGWAQFCGAQECYDYLIEKNAADKEFKNASVVLLTEPVQPLKHKPKGFETDPDANQLQSAGYIKEFLYNILFSNNYANKKVAQLKFLKNEADETCEKKKKRASKCLSISSEMKGVSNLTFQDSEEPASISVL